jgi:hypothetical protein
MSCGDTLNQECILRHKQQDEFNEKVDQMYEVICGGMEPENSMKVKVDTLYSERRERRSLNSKLFFTFAITLVTVIFWCGYNFAVIKNHEDRLDTIEAKLSNVIVIKDR